MCESRRPVNGADSAEALADAYRESALASDPRMLMEDAAEYARQQDAEALFASLHERLIDAEGESGACSDNECGCHRGARELREEIEDMEGAVS